MLSEKRENKKKPTFHPAALSTNPDHQLILSTPTAAAASRQFPRGDIIVAYSRWKLFESSCLERPSLTTQPPTHPSHPPCPPRSFVRSLVRSFVRPFVVPSSRRRRRRRRRRRLRLEAVSLPSRFRRLWLRSVLRSPRHPRRPYIGRSLESRRNSADALLPPLPVLSLSRASILIESEERRWRSARRRHSLCPVPENDDEAAAVESRGEAKYGEREAARVG